MIQPEEIRRKAENLYPQFLRAWLGGEQFFPRHVPCRKDLDESLAAAMASVQRLRADAKESRGFGYTVEWVERNSRAHGKNHFPQRIVFETELDFLKYVGKECEFRKFVAAVGQVKSRYSVLENWIRSHRQLLVELADEVDGLLEVVGYLESNPRPNVYARELPLSVDTKFVERNQRILREWLDLVLPPQTIRADETHFGRRYGLRYAEPLIHVRFLDSEPQRLAGSPWPECCIPLHALANTPLHVSRVVIIENKVNLLTCPPLAGGIALGGLGNGVTDLRYVTWLANSDLRYWGDIDVEGFQILSRLRIAFPSARSLLMDAEHLRSWHPQIGTTGTGSHSPPPTNLTANERDAYLICEERNLRIEQERFPQSFVAEYVASQFIAQNTTSSVTADV